MNRYFSSLEEQMARQWYRGHASPPHGGPIPNSPCEFKATATNFNGVDVFFACFHVRRMPMIQIRNVPDGLHRELKARAARAGQSLSEYLLGIISDAAERPEAEEIRLRIRERSPVYPSESPADALRAERDAR